MGLGKMMDFSVMFIVTTTLLLISYSPSAYSQPDLAQILTTAGFNTFLSDLQSTNTLEVLQAQAITKQGLTLFCPNDSTITDDSIPAWNSLTTDQLSSFLLFHALPHYYGATVKALTALAQLTNAVTMAGSDYTLNFTSDADYIYVNSGLTSAIIVTAVDDEAPAYPTAIYQIDHVLMPQAIFGAADISPPPPPPTTSTSTPSPKSKSKPSPPPPSTTSALSPNSTPSPPPPASTPSNSTPSTTTATTPHTIVTRGAAASFRIVGLGGWAHIVLGVSGSGMIFLLL